MKGKNYKIVSLYSFFPFEENLIIDLKNKLLEIENENDLSGLFIFASEGINGTICAEKNVIDIVINLLNKYADNRNLNIKVNFLPKPIHDSGKFYLNPKPAFCFSFSSHSFIISFSKLLTSKLEALVSF